MCHLQSADHDRTSATCQNTQLLTLTVHLWRDKSLVPLLVLQCFFHHFGLLPSRITDKVPGTVSDHENELRTSHYGLTEYTVICPKMIPYETGAYRTVRGQSIRHRVLPFSRSSHHHGIDIWIPWEQLNRNLADTSISTGFWRKDFAQPYLRSLSNS